MGVEHYEVGVGQVEITSWVFGGESRIGHYETLLWQGVAGEWRQEKRVY